MKILERLKETWAKYSPWTGAVSMYLFVMVNDWISSWADSKYVSTAVEMNPYVRDEALHYVFHKSWHVDLAYGILLYLTCYAFYKMVSPWSERVARYATAGGIFWVALDRAWTAVLGNYMILQHPVFHRPTIWDNLHL